MLELQKTGEQLFGCGTGDEPPGLETLFQLCALGEASKR